MKFILDGKQTALSLNSIIKKETEYINNNFNYKPGLAVVLVGENPASKIYVNAKIKKAEELGISSYKYNLPNNVSEDDLLEKIKTLNNDKNVNGILVQLPLPPHIDSKKILNYIDFKKDVDGLHPINQGKMYSDEESIYPCTPLGCHLLLKKYDINPSGKNVVVIGRSRLVGKPVANIMLQQNATISICHSKTENLKDYTCKADIIISAVGNPEFISEDMIKEDAVLLDVGISKTNQGIKGDINFESCKNKALAITPVPGGIGPMTVACLMYNTLIVSAKQKEHPLKFLPIDPLRNNPWLY